MKIDYNNMTMLKELGASYNDFWTPSVQGVIGMPPSRCYTYKPKGLRQIGFGANVKI